MKIKGKGVFAVICLLAAAMLLSGCEAKKQVSGEERKTVQGESAGEEMIMPIVFVNNTGGDIYALQASTTDTDDWEEDILEDEILEYGSRIQVDFHYLSNRTMWDISVVDEYGDRTSYYDIDFAKYSEEGITVVLNADGDAEIYEGTDVFDSQATSSTQRNSYGEEQNHTSNGGAVTYAREAYLIQQFSCIGDVLTIKGDLNPFDKEYTDLMDFCCPVAEDCIWGITYVGGNDIIPMSYKEVQEQIYDIRAQYLETYEVVSPPSLWVIVENNRVIRVLLLFS